MAPVTQVRLIDDLDGGDADESVDFTVDNKRYQMDLSEKNAARLREILAPFIAAARRSSGATTPAPAAAPPQPAPPARVRKPRPSGNGQVRTDSRSPHEAGSPPLCVRPTRTGRLDCRSGCRYADRRGRRQAEAPVTQEDRRPIHRRVNTVIRRHAKGQSYGFGPSPCAGNHGENNTIDDAPGSVSVRVGLGLIVPLWLP